VVVDAVRIEPVSHLVLLNREKYREFRRNRRFAPISASNQRVNSIASSRIPYAPEQGISKAVSGNFSTATGNLSSNHPIAWTKPHGHVTVCTRSLAGAGAPLYRLY
jgi:hypothetical protein